MNIHRVHCLRILNSICIYISVKEKSELFTLICYITSHKKKGQKYCFFFTAIVITIVNSPFPKQPNKIYELVYVQLTTPI